MGKAATAYKKMAGAVVPAACAAGDLLKDRMQKLIQGEASLSPFHSLANQVSVFKDEGNLVVGIGPTELAGGPAGGLWDQHVSVARQMDQRYQVADVAADLAKQSGEVEQKFYQELERAAGL